MPFLLVGALFFLPLSAMIGTTFSGGGWQLFKILREPYYRGIISFTLLQAGVSSAFAAVLGLPGAYLLGRYRFPGRAVAIAITTTPFILPPILVILGFVLFFGNSGVVNTILKGLLDRDTPPIRLLYSFSAIVLAHGFCNFPIVVRFVSSAWESLPENRVAAAKSMGAGRVRLFTTVTLPHLLPSLLSALSMIFLFCFLSFSIVLVLGGGPQYTSLEVEIFRLAKVSLDPNTATLLGTVGVIISSMVLFCTFWAERWASETVQYDSGDSSGLVPRRRGWSWSVVWIALYTALVLVVLLGPMVTVVVNSLRAVGSRGGESGWSLHWYRQLFFLSEGQSSAATRGMIRNSLLYAIATVVIALPLGSSFAHAIARGRERIVGVGGTMARLRAQHLLELVLMLPLGISPVILGLCYLRGFPLLPDQFTGGGWGIVLIHSMLGYPMVVRAVLPQLRGISPSLRDAASSLGASRARRFITLELPLIRGGILVGGIFAFTLSMGELNVAMILSREGSTTIPLGIYRLIGAYNLHGACALGTVLMLLCGVALYGVERIQRSYGG